MIVKEKLRQFNRKVKKVEKLLRSMRDLVQYVIDEARAREIILSLTPADFSHILQNEHKGYEYEKLYVFGRDVTLLERSGSGKRTVSLYIKFNKLESNFVIVISFHEQKYPLTYYFK